MSDIGHIRPPKTKAVLITVIPDSFQLFKMVFDAAVKKIAPNGSYATFGPHCIHAGTKSPSDGSLIVKADMRGSSISDEYSLGG